MPSPAFSTSGCYEIAFVLGLVHQRQEEVILLQYVLLGQREVLIENRLGRLEILLLLIDYGTLLQLILSKLQLKAYEICFRVVKQERRLISLLEVA